MGKLCYTFFPSVSVYVDSFQTKGPIFKQQETKLSTKSSIVFSILLHGQSSIVTIAFSISKTSFKKYACQSL